MMGRMRESWKGYNKSFDCTTHPFKTSAMYLFLFQFPFTTFFLIPHKHTAVSPINSSRNAFPFIAYILSGFPFPFKRTPRPTNASNQ